MTEKLKGRLSPVRTRQHWMSVIRGSAIGLFIGSIVALVLAFMRLGGFSVTPGLAIGITVGSTFVGALVALMCRPSWYAAANAVDAHYKLKDRSSTALQFSVEKKDSQIHQLQVLDAIEHLKKINVKAVTPMSMPRLVPVAGGIFALAAILICLPLNSTADASLAPVPEHIVEIADDLAETMMEDLEELKKQVQEEDDNKELEKLVSELDELLEEMKEDGVDEREALAKLSEMQAAVAEAQAEFNMDLVDANMQAMGEAMDVSTAMQAASKALKEGEYEKAAEDLEALNPEDVTKKEAKTVAKELKKLAESMGEAGLGQLSEATSEFTEGLEGGKSGQCKSGACKLAKLSKKYALRKSIGECLGCQLAKLGECKGNCNKNGGLAKDKSNKPTNSWGRGSTGNPFGEEATRIDSERQQENVTGTPGEGPSEREIAHSPEGRQNATREYRQNYKQFKKATEEVLRSEALPLGHRQTIRKYFEAIRPDNESAEEADSLESNN